METDTNHFRLSFEIVFFFWGGEGGSGGGGCAGGSIEIRMTEMSIARI